MKGWGMLNKVLEIPAHLTLEKVNAILNMIPSCRNRDYLKSANLILNENSFSIPPFGVVKYDSDINWRAETSRRFERLLYGHTFLGCLAEGFRETRDERYLAKGLEIIRDWVSKFSYEKDADTMAYHDETTALRLKYWLRLYILSKGTISEMDSEFLEMEMEKLARLLANQKFHSTGTNHGMFQDIALLTYSLYFQSTIKNGQKYRSISIQRIVDYFTLIFTDEGIHKEHSPAYHLIISTNITKLVKLLQQFDPEKCEYFSNLLKNSEKYFVHVVRPDGHFPPISDTEPNRVKAGIYKSPEAQYVISIGELGTQPKENNVIFKNSGYAIFRDDWALKDKATYVHFAAAYHVAFHKHCDDLNLSIYSNGEIITEAGANGYNYDDPFTKYAYSSFAHNSLIVDGSGLQRTDRKIGKVFISECDVSEDAPMVTGVNERYKGVSHERTVQFRKQDKLVTAYDKIESRRQHEYQLLWHLAPDIEARIKGQVAELFRNNIKVMEIEFKSSSIVSLNSVRGQTSPYIQGWVFPKMETKQEATVIEVNLSGRTIDCLTEFKLGNFTNESQENFGSAE